MSKQYDYLIVGAGLYGAMFAFQAARHGKRCLVIDRRNTTGGNLYCENIDGIIVHCYGPHIFHTSDPETWEFVNSITPFHSFINSPVASSGGRRYSLPFNMNTFSEMWGVKTEDEARRIIEEQKSEARKIMEAEGVEEPRNLEEQALCTVGKEIYDRLIKGYTEKQWGRKCTDLPAFIIKRLPVRFTWDNNYFDDTFQGIPDRGYNALVEGLLKGTEVLTGTDFFASRAELEEKAEHIIFTGSIDRYYGYEFGKLEYRSLRFESETLDTPDFQHNAVVNYTDSSVPYTRIVEHKHFDPFNPAFHGKKSVITKEYPTEWREGAEPFYPVNDPKNTAVYEKYAEKASLEQNVTFGGRLGRYRYYDMAPIVTELLRKEDF